MHKHLNKSENAVLNELQTVSYQGVPLIDLVIKNYTERRQTFEQISSTLYALHIEGKVDLTSDTINCHVYDKLIIAHYELMQNKRG